MTAVPLVSVPIDVGASQRRAWRAAAKAFRARVRLPPKHTLSEWADRYRVLSPESSAEPGAWRTDRVPFLREIMDAISGREYQDITVVKSAQTAGTELINNAVGFFIDQEPSPLLVIQPNVKPMAEAWSKDRLAPMLRDSPRLRGKVKDPRARDSGNTVLHKIFAAGTITVIGANSPAGLASRPIRVVLADELDRWTKSAGTEGDPLALAEKRTITYRHRKKVVKVSTPGNEGESRIEREWLASDQRHYYVSCPHCGHEQPLEWRDSDGRPGLVAGRGPYRLQWVKETPDGAPDAEPVHRPETAHYVCRACETAIEETHKPDMLARGRWVKHNPASKRAGFHISGLLSPWVRWREIAAEWLRVQDDSESRKTFINTMLGLLYVESGEVPDARTLESRLEKYSAEVPMGAGILTAAIDVQEDRLELQVTGWGDREESWLVQFARLYGDPEADDVWQQADALLLRGWRHASGTTLYVQRTMVDSGYATDRVYQFVRPRQSRQVYAAKGNDDAKVPLSRASRANRDGVKVFIHSPTKFKDTLFARLKRPVPGAGYYHFGLHAQTGTDAAYFTQFSSERRAVRYERGRYVVTYTNPKRLRNEAIDLSVLTLIALRTMGIAVTQRLRQIAAQVAARGTGASGAASDASSDTGGARASDGGPSSERATSAADAAGDASHEEAGSDHLHPTLDEGELSDIPARPPTRRRRRGGGWINRW